MVDTPKKIWIEQDDCPYFYYEDELSEVGSPVTEYTRSDLVAELATENEWLKQTLEVANKRADEVEAALWRVVPNTHTIPSKFNGYADPDPFEGPGEMYRDAYLRLEAALEAANKRVAVMQEALEIIAGKRQCLDNLMGNKDVALAALTLTSEGVKE